ncbi:MAG TPA: RecQ family ATP-dependent DNA helicase [Bacteroidetes bacterium]|nr:RecQ family ATP-dependent DNA helicase [Bacteroidota bacterium]
MSKNSEASDLYHQILQKYWGYTKFRPLQEEIIFSVANGNDTLALMPTGGGKSLTYQVPALAKEGLCLVITPLVALMKDQVNRLRSMDIKAIAIYSGMMRDEIDVALNNCIYGDYKFLYVSPERLNTDIFRMRVEKMNINLIAVDEAHCISQWGYDFRPSYLRIAELRMILPEVPVLAVTATATADVVEDIQKQLKFRSKIVLKTTFERKNLAYLVKETDDKNGYLIRLARNIQGSGIAYVRTRKHARDLAMILKDQGISADFYHAGLSHELRDRKQTSWSSGEFRIMVATNAFGMGIDKADVRFVVHMDMPDSLEAYFQEAGRAGRDAKKAWAILLYNEGDKQKLEQRARVNYPEIEEIKKVYEALGNYYQIPVGSAKNQTFDFVLSDFVSRYKFNVMIAYNSLKFLEREGYIELTEDVHNPSRIHFTVSRDQLYKFQVANASFDAFIKLLLRSYTGLFTEFVPVFEENMARKTGIPAETIKKYLHRLNNLHIIRYIPKKDTPLLIFTEERLDPKALYISPENYRQRKEIYLKKQEAVWRYATNRNMCRSRFLLDYFGETSDHDCGICDVCREINEITPDKKTFDILQGKIREILQHHPGGLDIKELIKLADAKEENKIMIVIRWLLDNGYIAYIPDTNLLKCVKAKN